MTIQPIISDNANTTKLMRYCKLHENDECKVLDKAEEQALIAEWIDKDIDKLRQMLIMHNVAIVFNLAKNWMQSARSYDDLIQRGMTGLSIAAQKYDFKQKKTKFSSYAYTWIYKYLYDTYWAEHRRKDIHNEAISLDSAIAEYASNSKSSDSDSGDMGNYLENHLDVNQKNAIADTETQVSQNAMTNLYRSMQQYVLSNDFTDVDRIVFDGAFVNNQNLSKISSESAVPLKQIKSSYAKLLDKMRAKLASNGVNSMEDIF